MGWFGVDQKSHSVRMLCNCINMHLTTRYYHERVTEKSHEDIVYCVRFEQCVVINTGSPGLKKDSKTIEELNKKYPVH